MLYLLETAPEPGDYSAGVEVCNYASTVRVSTDVSIRALQASRIPSTAQT
jgi:hypothetical protein